MNDEDRPLVLRQADLAAVESIPLSERNLPPSTYDVLARTAARHADDPALYLLGENGRDWRDADHWTYADLLGHVTQAANLYHSLGLTPGGVVGLLLPNSGATHAALFGAQAAGVAGPVNPSLTEEHITAILTLTGAQILVAAGPALDPALWEKAVRIAEALPALRVLLAVGGPPGPDTPGRYAGDFAALAAGQPADRLLSPYRPGPADLAAYFHTGGTTEIGRASCRERDRDRALMADFWRIIEHYRVTGFSGVPTVYAALPPIPPDVDISSLRAGAVGAAPLPKSVRDSFESTAKVPMLEGYGLTEATCATAAMPALDPRPGSVGLRLPYQRVKAVRVDADERPIADCGPGENGVLAIAGPSVFPGYLRPGPHGPAPDPSGKIFDGWLLTGDLGRVDQDGYLYLTGRAKDLIIRGGHNIDPGPVEESLLDHPEITAAAVIGAPDAHSGEVPVAYVTLRPGARVTEEELRQWAAGHVPEPAAAPKAVRVLDALPLTAIGKIFKPALLQDAIRRVVRTELDRAGLAAEIDMTTKDGRPHVLIRATGDAQPLRQRLERYNFPFEIEE